MFAMHQHSYAYSAPQASAPRHYSGHGTSSAFSSSANPDEDWTKISDLAERRRIQNRIAQRNYRKKLKRRLEDLEQMAGTKQSNKRPSPVKAKAPKPQQSRPQQTGPLALPKLVAESQYTPPMHNDDYLSPPTTYDERERSHTPPLFGYSTYPPPPEDLLLASYSAAQAYRPLTAEVYPGDYLTTTVPVTLPSMTHFSDAIKRDSSFGTDSSMSPYLTYDSYLPGLDMGTGAPSSYDNSNPLTPPLSHSFDHSGNCSDAGSYEYPTTPLSMPGSPGMMPQ